MWPTNSARERERTFHPVKNENLNLKISKKAMQVRNRKKVMNMNSAAFGIINLKTPKSNETKL